MAQKIKTFLVRQPGRGGRKSLHVELRELIGIVAWRDFRLLPFEQVADRDDLNPWVVFVDQSSGRNRLRVPPRSSVDGSSNVMSNPISAFSRSTVPFRSRMVALLTWPDLT